MTLSNPTGWWDDLRHQLVDELRDLRVAVYGSGGAPYHHAGLAALWGARVEALGAEQIKAGALDGVDVIVFPGGGARAMGGMLDPLGTDGAAAVRAWVAQGGMYVGSCAGSFLPAIVGNAYWSAHPESRELHMVCARLANGVDSEWEGLTSPGVGVLEMEVSEPTHWLARDLPARFRLVHYNGPMFVPVDPERHDPRLGTVEGVARFVARTERFTPSEAFMGGAAGSAARVFDDGVGQGAFTAVATGFGEGLVVLYGSHPEFGVDAIQLGWGEGTRLFANALRHQASRRRGASGAVAGRRAPAGAGDADRTREVLRTLAPRFERLSERFAAFAAEPPEAWLREGCVAGFMGRTPTGVWRDALASAAEVTASTARYLASLADRTGAEIVDVAAFVDEDAPAGQDYGFMGLRQLATAIESAMDASAARLQEPPECLEHPYDQLDRHPYQLLASSYLSAAGLAACAALSSAVVGARAGYLEGVPVGPTRDPIATPSPQTTMGGPA
jgi:hypothetical protein